jgi:predicted AAA+ superfamily ATPase
VLDIRKKFGLSQTFSLFRSSSSPSSNEDHALDAVGQNAWSDRIEAEKNVERWLSEYPSTFITLTGPPGSGKQSLLSRVLKKEEKYIAHYHTEGSH